MNYECDPDIPINGPLTVHHVALFQLTAGTYRKPTRRNGMPPSPALLRSPAVRGEFKLMLLENQ